MKMTPQQYCLRWKHHHSNVQNMFAQLLEKERFCDVTLYCSPNFATQVPNKDMVEPQNIRGVSLRAHRVVLAACSELLGSLLGAHDGGEPVLVIDGAEPRHLRALLDYMYTGEMSVHHSQLASLLKTAEELRIKGLTDICWNNKDEPPDCHDSGIITTTSDKVPTGPKTPEPKQPEPMPELRVDRGRQEARSDEMAPLKELRAYMKRDDEGEGRHDKFSVNGGPPPLIKLPTKEKSSPIKRENSDTDTPSPKRHRLASGTENTDDESAYQCKTERDEWQHGNLDISAERVVGWGGAGSRSSCSRSGSSRADDDDWEHAPADIGSFLHTRLQVDGDNSNDEDSAEESNPLPTPSAALASSLAAITSADIKLDLMHASMIQNKPTTSKSSTVDPRFGDVVKLNDYLQHGRRPQFWEENYVRRVMEAVRLKELEMKQAAEILGVSYGTLYGRYRDVYGCINRPYSGKFFFDRTARDFWQAKGPSEVLERLQRGEVSIESASQALGVTPNNLAAYLADMNIPEKVSDFEPIPIEVDPSLRAKPPAKRYKPAQTDKPPIRKLPVGVDEEEAIPVAVIEAHSAAGGKWSARPRPTSPSALMRSRPDLTIVAARRHTDDTTHTHNNN